METRYGPYSPSRLETANCAKRFYHQYIAKDIGDTSSIASRRGNVVHETLEAITNSWLEEKGMDWPQVEAYTQQKIIAYKLTDEESIETSFRAAKVFMDNPPKSLETIVGTEENLALKRVDGEWEECEWDDTTCVVRCKIDILQIDGHTATIIDHKTQFNKESADTFQMKFYAWMVKQFYPFVTKVNTVLHFARPELNSYSFPVEHTLEDISLYESIIMSRISSAEAMTNENDDYEAAAGHHCTYCPMKLDCEILDKAKKKSTQLNKVKGGPIMNASEAQDVGAMIIVMDEVLKVLKSKMKAFNKEIGPVVVNGKEIGYKASKGWAIPTSKEKELFEFIKEGGIDPLDVFKPDVKILQKIGRQATKQWNEKITEEFLEEVLKTTHGSRRV